MYTVHRRVPKRTLHGRAGVDAVHVELLVCLRASGGVRHGGARQGAQLLTGMWLAMAKANLRVWVRVCLWRG
jgi:hypothetical protein